MKLLFICSLLISQIIWAFGSVDLTNVDIDYRNGSGSAKFDKLRLGMGTLEVDVDHLHQLDVDYKQNAYEITQRFDNKTFATFRWKMTEGTQFFNDLKDDIYFTTNGPVQVRLGTRKTDIDVPKLSFANKTIVLEAKNLTAKCDHPKGFMNPNDYIVHVLKACLVNSRIKLQSLVSRQEDINKPLISEDFDSILAEAKHPLAEKTGIDLNKHRTSLKDKQLVDQLDIRVTNGQMFLDMFIKVFSIPIRVEFYGPVRIIEKTKQLRVHVDTFKVLGVNFSKQLMKMVTNFLKKYQTKVMKVEYPFIYVDIESLYSVDY